MAAVPTVARRIARSGVLPLCCRPPAWDRPPGLPLAPCRSFSNNKIQVELDESSGVAMMKFKSPPVNSLSLDFLTEFSISLEKLENDRACRGVIITSAVPKIFSSGLDIMEMCGKSTEHYAEFWRAVQEMWLRLYGSNMVTVAAVNGNSPAGGCLVALSCDYRIMAENPKFSIGLNEAQLGIVAPFWFKDTFVNIVGHRIAERSLQLGSLHPAPEAHRFGLVDELVPEEKLLERAAAVMAQWLALPGGTVQILPLDKSQESVQVEVSVAHRCWSDSEFPVYWRVSRQFTITVMEYPHIHAECQRLRDEVKRTMLLAFAWEKTVLPDVKDILGELRDHARQLTKSMMRKALLDRLVAHREEDIKNFISFISKESIQKSLRMYMEMLKKKKS